MKKMAYILVLFLALFLVLNCAWINAAQDSDGQVSTITLVVEPACQLGITDETVTETLVRDSTSETAFDAGYVELDPDKPTLEVSSNKTWKLTAKITNSSGPYPKKAKDLMLKNTNPEHVVNGFDVYKSLARHDQEIASYTSGVSGESHPCQYKVLLDWEKDIPGTYETTITYTLSTTGS